jgi:Uma2 family endonuclease
MLEFPEAEHLAQEVIHELEEERKRRREFYQTITDSQKAEFIEGEMVVHSPVVKKHNAISKRLVKILDTYVLKKNLGFVGMEKILVRLTRNDFEPDVCFFKAEKAKDFTDDQLFFPAPDLVVEVLSPSTEKNDRGIKFRDYAYHGVAEYWIVDPQSEVLEQYLLDESQGAYRLEVKVKEGAVSSSAITGLHLPVRAIFDDQTSMTVMQEMF